MKCVCRCCFNVINLKEPKLNNDSSFWGGKCPKCRYYGPMWRLDDFIEYRNRLNSVKI